MKILEVFKQIRKMKKAGGNYGFIAQNVGTIYTAIGLTKFGKTLDMEHRLYATGLIDIIAYLQDGTMSEQSVADSIVNGYIGQVGLGLYQVKHRQLFEQENNQHIIGFTMQLEAFIFEASNCGIGYKEIVNSVIDNKSTIAGMINKTLEEGTKCQLFDTVMQNVSVWAAQSDFQQTVLAFESDK